MITVKKVYPLDTELSKFFKAEEWYYVDFFFEHRDAENWCTYTYNLTYGTDYFKQRYEVNEHKQMMARWYFRKRETAMLFALKWVIL